MDRKFMQEFANPGSEYRGAPFWAWNGKLEPEELRRQIRVMKAMGLGGGFMHSRVGLDTAYLSEEWFECVDACIDECRKLGMNAWLYDEDRWPSGAAGGLVTSDPKYRRRYLFMRQTDKLSAFKMRENTIALFTGRVEGSRVYDVKRLPKKRLPRKLGKGESILSFSIELEMPSRWYNNAAYLNTISHESVKQFIKVTHEAYKKKCGDEFGKTVPGIFTDEPNYGMIMTETPHPWARMPEKGIVTVWTDELPAVFRKRYGYNILKHLPELYLDVEGESITPARWHYHDCITHLFTDAFARQIGEWCERNKLLFTGHILMEGNLSDQTLSVGSCMRFYEHMQSPGMDILTQYWREYDTAKQVSSAARQFGRKWRLTETYGCTGWDFPFSGHKAIGDWQAALGINLRCQHLSWYTMEGEAKRDYPASIFHQSPWWQAYSKVEDYFARIHAAMTRGTEVRDLLVIHPIESMWTLCRKDWKENPETVAYDQMLVDLRDSLLAENIDYDYADEELLSRYGKVRTGRKEPILSVAKADYKAVLVPPLKTMRESTLKILKRFKKAGGTIIFAGDVVRYIDAQPSEEVVIFSKECPRIPAKGIKTAAAVEGTCRRVSIEDGAGKQIKPALYLLREDKDTFYLFVCNTGHDYQKSNMGVFHEPPVRKRTDVFPEVRIRGFAECNGTPLELYPDTGECFTADAGKSAGKWTINTSLPKLGSRLFVIPKKKKGPKYPKRANLKILKRIKFRDEKYKFTLSECNSVVLDFPAYRIGNGRWRKPDEILRVDQAVRDALGTAYRGGDMVQPWAQEKKTRLKSVPVALSYTFEVCDIPSGDLFLALENPGAFDISVNGVELNKDAECGWWVDKSLRKIPVNPAVIKSGTNKVELCCDYKENFSGLEIVYLLGSFGTRVSKSRKVEIISVPDTLRIGNWVKQGLSFYSGSVTYLKNIDQKMRKGQRLFLVIPEYKGAAVRIHINGRPAGIMAWEPNEIDITDHVADGPVQLGIEVFGSRRNSHGPLHLKMKDPEWMGPEQFMSRGKIWSDEYIFEPCGLMSAPCLEVRA